MLTALGLDATAEAVYRQMLARPDWGVTQLVAHLDLAEAAVRTALDQLFHLALVRDSADRPGSLHVVDPAVGLAAALAEQEADLDRRRRQVADSQATIARLIDDFSTDRRAWPDASAAQLSGLDAVRDKLAEMARDTQFEILTFMPGGGQSPAALQHARSADTELLKRGVRILTVGLDSIRHHRQTMEHARFLTESGAEFRTSPTLPPRMVVADRCAVLVPIDPADTSRGALYLTGLGLVASMMALFERVWELATPLGVVHAVSKEGLTGQERTLLRLLGQGLTDEAAAARLGCSPRTTRRMMADLMERLEARSRFEAGLRAAQRGWL